MTDYDEIAKIVRKYCGCAPHVTGGICIMCKAADAITALVKERAEAEARSESRGRILLRTRDKLVNIKDEIISEGDRTFFGSTNHADDFCEVVETLDGFKWDRIMREGKKDTPFKDATARADAAEAEVVRLREVLAPFEKLASHVPQRPNAITWEHGVELLSELQAICDARKALEKS